MTVPTSSAMAPSPLAISVLVVVAVVTCVLSSMLFKGKSRFTRRFGLLLARTTLRDRRAEGVPDKSHGLRPCQWLDYVFLGC